MSQDLDQGGTAIQRMRVYDGPSLGWVLKQVRPPRRITTGGTTLILPGDSLILVDVAALVTIQLPSVQQWLLEPYYQPATPTERIILIKDFGGNAAAFNITVAPSGTDPIDKLVQSFTIIQNRQILRLLPNLSPLGWISI